MFLTLLLAGFILAVTFVLYWYLNEPKNLPPGPKGLPVIGSMLDTWDTPKQYLLLQEWSKKYGPLFKVYVANKMVMVLADYKVIQEALVKQADIFAGRPQVMKLVPEKYWPYGIFLTEGDIWKEQRRFAVTTLREFGLGKSSLEPHIQEEVEYLTNELAKHANGPGFNMHRMVNNAVANVICQLVFGKRYEYDDATFGKQLMVLTKRAAESNISFLSPLLLCPWVAKTLSQLPAAKRLLSEGAQFVAYIDEQCQVAAKDYDPSTPPTCYVHAFKKAAKEQQGTSFHNEQLVSTVIDLFAAGTETASSAIRWAVLYLARMPELQEKMYQELREGMSSDANNNKLPNYADRARFPLTEAVLMEIQRIAALSPLSVIHKTTAPTKLMGYDIPEGTLAIPLLWNVLSDPETFPNPEKFDPYRFLDEEGKVKRHPNLIPFSSGRRVCIGEGLAWMELFVFFTGIFSRFRFFYPPGEPIPTLTAGVGFVRAPTPYNICVEMRN